MLDPASGDVIGCVYIYPVKSGATDAEVASWVRATHAALDVGLRDAVSVWLESPWQFERFAYARAS